MGVRVKTNSAKTPSRGAFLGTAAAGMTGALLGVPMASGAAADAKAPPGWDKLLDAANREGKLSIYGPPGDELYAAMVTRFQKAYPNIRVDGAFAVGGDIQTRVLAERSAQRYIPDIWINGSTAALTALKPVGALEPLDAQLVLPEVRDRSLWFQNQLWWNDAAAPLSDISFQGLMYPTAYVNTQLVNVNEFKSYWDFADPKWRGKVVSNDIRIAGPGGVPARFIYKNSKLGPAWFDKFFGTLDVVLSRDQRQMVDWLAQGRYAMAAFINTDEAHVAINQGLPIAAVPLANLREGGAIAPGGGAVALMKPAPHPNAAKLYVNWLLSRDGQTAWQEEVKAPSLRIDLPKNGLYLAFPTKSSAHFVNGGLEEYSLITTTVFRDLLDGILNKAGKA